MIGTQTFGKGTVQMRHSLRPGDRDTRVEMKLTVAEYKLGDEALAIESGEGLTPDLWVRPATFSRGGVTLPELLEAPGLLYVRERSGWREGVETSRGDHLITLADRILVSSEGWHRADVLAAIEQVLPSSQEEEAIRLQETFRYRGLDWRPAPRDGGAPQIDVQMSVIDPPIAGEKVEIRAEVQNLGEVPLYQLRVQLSAKDDKLPWDHVTLPVGYLPPGEHALGSAMVTVPPRSPSRVDPVYGAVYADRRPVIGLDPVALSIMGRPLPRLAAETRMSLGADGIHRVIVDLENLSEEPLTELRVWLALPEDTGVELLEREVSVAGLDAGTQAQVALGVRTPEGSEGIDVELRVEAEGRGEILRVPLHVDVAGTSYHIEPPQIEVIAPTEAPTGHLTIPIVVSDDRRIDSLSVWWDHDQIIWRAGQGATLSESAEVVLGHSHHVLTVEVIDDQGARTTERFHLQGGGALEDAAGEDGAADQR